VRVEQGDQNRKTVYSNEPLEVVRNFARNGAMLVHVVDLNAAIKNDIDTNSSVIARILSEREVGIQLAGGIRSSSVAKDLLQKGAQRIVISSIAYSKPEEAFAMLQTFGAGRVVLALDYDGQSKVRTAGWSKQQTETVYEAVSRFSKIGFDYFLTTAVQRDGLLSGPDYESLKRLRASNPKSSARIIASGGITSEEDLANLSRLGMDEAIVGKAFYEGRISLSTIPKFLESD
jgi:phosphoribosylformimino-5-aminoimidazole carboxamide ribotide isomerase